MYRKHFGLTRLPFKSSPDISVFYKHGSRQDILEALVYTVVRGDGITKVTGEVGSGKTMLLRLLADSLPSNFSILYITAPNLSPKDMLMYICSELNLPINSSMLKFTLLNSLNNELLKLHAAGRRVVMLIDEAQAMTFDTLEEIRLLSNLETNDEKLLQIVLFGQPELDIALANDKIRQLKSRISYSIFIPALSPDEVNSYLNYRMRKASYEGLDLFDANISKEIHKLSLGMPRTINMIADKLLMSAYSYGDERVTKKHLSVLPDVAGSLLGKLNSYKYVFFISLLLIAMAIGVVYLMSDSQQPSLNEQINLEYSDSKVDSMTVDEVQLPNAVIMNDQVPIDKVLTDTVIESNEASELNEAQLYAATKIVTVDIRDTVKSNPISVSDRLLAMHLKSERWLRELPSEMYIIQLAAPSIRQLEATIEFYSLHKIPKDKLHFLIDISEKGQKKRLRVLYLVSESYSTLQHTITGFSQAIKKSSPYVVTVGPLVKNLEYTQNYLKQHGITNVNQ